MVSPVSSLRHLLRLLPLHYGQLRRGFHSGKASSSLEALQPESPSINVPVDESLKKGNLPTTWDVDADDALEHADFFGLNNIFTVKDLFDARVHYGHKYTSLDDRMKQFVFGIRAEHVIFDLDITAYHLRQALNFTAHIAFRGGVILFVARSPMNSFVIEETALECKEYAHTRSWSPGLFLQSRSSYGAVTRLPDLVIALSTIGDLRREHPVIAEAAKCFIPCVGIVDSNCDPSQVTYPVPGNDDSPQAIELYCKIFKEAILRGKQERIERLQAIGKALEAEAAAKASSVQALEDFMTNISKSKNKQRSQLNSVTSKDYNKEKRDNRNENDAKKSFKYRENIAKESSTQSNGVTSKDYNKEKRDNRNENDAKKSFFNRENIAKKSSTQEERVEGNDAKKKSSQFDTKSRSHKGREEP